MARIKKSSGRVVHNCSTKASFTRHNDNVTLKRNYVVIKYRSGGEQRIVKLSKESLIASGREALSKVPVSFN